MFVFKALRELLVPANLRRILGSLFEAATVNNACRKMRNYLGVFLRFLSRTPLSSVGPCARFLKRKGVPCVLFNLPTTTLTVCHAAPRSGGTGMGTLVVTNITTYFISNVARPLRFSFVFVTPTLFIFRTVVNNVSFVLVSLLKMVINGANNKFVSFLL